MKSDIETLLLEGWRPRIKKVKGRRYITVLKGKKERSLGPYTEELWEKVKPVDPWATPEQLSKLEKRIFDIDRKQRKQNTDFNALIFKKVKQLEEAQQGTNPSLLEKRITQLEESQRGSKPYLLKRRISKLEDSQQDTNPSLLEKRVSKLEEMRNELLESVESKLRDAKVCKHIDKNGWCHHWHYTSDEIEKREYLQHEGRSEYKGKIVYFVNVRKYPLLCSSCPDYET